MQRVFDARLFFFHFDFSSRANFDDGDAAGELSQTFLQFLAVVVRSGFFDLRTDLRDTPFDSRFLAGAFDDRGIVLVDDHAFGAAEIFERYVFQLDAQLFGDHLAIGQDRDIFEHRFTAIAKSRSFDGDDFQRAADLVHDQGRQELRLRPLRR